jgi:hypothetical protein
MAMGLNCRRFEEQPSFCIAYITTEVGPSSSTADRHCKCKATLGKMALGFLNELAIGSIRGRPRV